jgi:hypothetical protein
LLPRYCMSDSQVLSSRHTPPFFRSVVASSRCAAAAQPRFHAAHRPPPVAPALPRAGAVTPSCRRVRSEMAARADASPAEVAPRGIPLMAYAQRAIEGSA